MKIAKMSDEQLSLLIAESTEQVAKAEELKSANEKLAAFVSNSRRAPRTNR